MTFRYRFEEKAFFRFFGYLRLPDMIEFYLKQQFEPFPTRYLIKRIKGNRLWALMGTIPCKSILLPHAAYTLYIWIYIVYLNIHCIWTYIVYLIYMYIWWLIFYKLIEGRDWSDSWDNKDIQRKMVRDEGYCQTFDQTDTVESVQKDNFWKLIVLINLLFQKKIVLSQKFEIVLIDKLFPKVGL